ncbi:hypothetical protein K525DRAFT_286408 [Schizophyllum commune Loenen D]|nr:hypothetical protein K525DRAFT_286408 [Schizophyllum commune Loenen D]
MTNFPSIGLFPSGTTSPHAFSPFHQPPREMYTMYAALATGSTPSSASTGRSRSTSSLTSSMWPKRSKSAKA